MRRHNLIFPLLTLFALSGCTPHVNLNAPFGSRPPNEHEVFYTAVAADFHYAKMCEKISSRALDERGPDLSSTDWYVNGQRSACYFYLAMRTGDEQFCKFVKSIITVPSNHSGISNSRCVEILRKGQRQYSGIPAGNVSASPGLMEEMGYHDEDRYEAQYADNGYNNPVYEFYLEIKNSDDFKSKVRNLPNYAEANSPPSLRLANEDELITAMLAVEDAIPALCEKISPNSYSESEPSFNSGAVARGGVRNSCFSAIAFHTRTPGLCSRIIPIESNLPGMNFVNRKYCEDSIRFAIRDNEKPPRPSPQYFPKMSEFVHSLQKLGYEKPFHLGPNEPNWSTFYLHLIYHSRTAEKQEFLKRAEALPSFIN